MFRLRHKWMSHSILVAALALTAGSARARGFALVASAFLDENHKPSARVTAEIPYSNLVFLKRDNGYESRYEIYLKILDDEDNPARTAVLKGQAVADTYEETGRRSNRSKVVKVFELEPGEYKIEATVVVKNTHLRASRSVKLTVPDFLKTGIGFGTPLVLSVPSRRVGPLADWEAFSAEAKVEVDEELDLAEDVFNHQPAVKFELFVEQGIEKPLDCELFYEVLDAEEQQTLYGRHEIELRAKNAYLLSFNVDDWDPGSYIVNLRATTEDPPRETTANVRLNVEVTRAMLSRNFDQTLSILSLIATSEELEGLKAADESERGREWAKFWKARDPDPGTADNEALRQHLARVNYVNRHFSKLGPGWRSDRGRIYIQYGAPDRVETATDQRYQGEYLIWRYFDYNRVFVFYDEFGVGDYRLVERLF